MCVLPATRIKNAQVNCVTGEVRYAGPAALGAAALAVGGPVSHVRISPAAARALAEAGEQTAGGGGGGAAAVAAPLAALQPAMAARVMVVAAQPLGGVTS